MEQSIKCSSCKRVKNTDEFGVKKNGDIYKKCMRCSESAKNWRLNNADKAKESCKNWYLNNADKVKERDKNRYLNNPEKEKERCKNYRLNNPEKAKESCKNWYLNNADKVKESSRNYYLNNFDKVKERVKNYRLNNPEKVKEFHKNWKLNIKENNPIHYLAILQREQISRCLKLTDLKKKGHSIEYLGCDAEYLYNFLKNKIDIWNETSEQQMTFENIHIDHIKPISLFDFDCEDAEANLLDCCNYTNLQPLLIADNLSKKNRWTDEDDAYWITNIKGNDEYRDIYLSY